MARLPIPGAFNFSHYSMPERVPKRKRQAIDSPGPVAILVDGGFFLKRYREVYANSANHDAARIVNNLYTMVMKHAEDKELYRIFFYDCPPIDKKSLNPVTKQMEDFSKKAGARFRSHLYSELKRKRKIALRLGKLSGGSRWRIRPDKITGLLDGSIQISDLTKHDVQLDVRQKGVDIKIGVDIASLAFKEQVKQIVLVSGDSDFVPAAKLARREGIDFILDPMWNPVNPDLHEHVDGLRSTCPKPKKSTRSATRMLKE